MEDFPRGHDGSGVKKKTKKTEITPEEASILAGKKPKRETRTFDIQHLSYEGLSEGLLTLGRVCFVKEQEVVVSLPGRTVGSIGIRDVSTPYSKALKSLQKGTYNADENTLHTLKGMFRVGDLLIVKVIQITKTEEGHHVVKLTTNPKEIHSNWHIAMLQNKLVMVGAVVSKEEHGYIMDVGMPGVTAFLSKANAGTFLSTVLGGEPLGVGQLVPVKILDHSINRLSAKLDLTANPKVVHSTKLDDCTGISSSYLIPGMLVDAIVMETHKTGMKVHILEMVGLIYQDHLAEAWGDATKFEIGSTITARILYVPSNDKPYLTLQPSLWPYGPYRTDRLVKKVFIGSLESCRVVKLDKRGVIVRLDKSKEKGIVPMQRCSDDLSLASEDIAKLFAVNSIQSCRVIEHCEMDGIYLCSFQESLKEHKLFKVNQVEAGEKIKCEILAWNHGGAVVQFGYKITGFLPNVHISDAKLSNPRERFPPHTKILCRVMEVRTDGDIPHVIITAKKSLVRSKGAVLTNYTEAQVGMAGEAVIRKVLAEGLQVSTIGGLKAFMPKSKITKEKMDLTILYSQGQTISYKVQEVKPDRNSLILSLRRPEDESVQEEVEVKEKDPQPKKGRNSKHKKGKGKDEVSENLSLVSKVGKKREADVSVEESPLKAKKRKSMAEVDKNILSKAANGTDEGGDVVVKVETGKKKQKRNKIKKDKKINLKEIKHGGLALEGSAIGSLEVPSSDQFWRKEAEETDAEKYTMDVIEQMETPEIATELSGKRSKSVKVEVIPDSDSNKKDHASKSKREKLDMSPAEFEKLLVESPNSADIWIDYMDSAVAASTGDLSAAREIGRKATESISYREDEQRLKMWCARLKLEVMFGNEDSIKPVLGEAERRHDKFKVHSRLATFYEQAAQVPEAEKWYKRALSGFKNRPEAHTNLAKFYYRSGKLDLARAVMMQACAPSQNDLAQHRASLFAKFGTFELDHGDRERGKSLFNDVVEAYPTRTDIWIVSYQALFKRLEYDSARELMRKVLRSGMKPKQVLPIIKQAVVAEKRIKDFKATVQFQAEIKEYFALHGFENEGSNFMSKTF